MFRRKLAALNHPRCNEFDPKNDSEFKNLIVWIEDQKIRHYKIEDRSRIRNIKAKDWDKALASYLKALECPFATNDRPAVTDWIIGLAVRLEFADNVAEKGYNDVTAKTIEARKSKSALESIKTSDSDFHVGVQKLANILKIPLHEDDLVTLEAVKLLVEERLSKNANEKQDVPQKRVKVPLDLQELGFDTGDQLLNKAARVLRLLHINELRKLQTDINNAIVAVQALTANPKTNQSLGKVGRS